MIFLLVHNECSIFLVIVLNIKKRRASSICFEEESYPSFSMLAKDRENILQQGKFRLLIAENKHYNRLLSLALLCWLLLMETSYNLQYLFWIN